MCNFFLFRRFHDPNDFIGILDEGGDRHTKVVKRFHPILELEALVTTSKST